MCSLLHVIPTQLCAHLHSFPNANIRPTCIFKDVAETPNSTSPDEIKDLLLDPCYLQSKVGGSVFWKTCQFLIPQSQQTFLDYNLPAKLLCPVPATFSLRFEANRAGGSIRNVAGFPDSAIGALCSPRTRSHALDKRANRGNSMSYH